MKTIFKEMIWRYDPQAMLRLVDALIEIKIPEDQCSGARITTGEMISLLDEAKSRLLFNSDYKMKEEK